MQWGLSERQDGTAPAFSKLVGQIPTLPYGFNPKSRVEHAVNLLCLLNITVCKTLRSNANNSRKRREHPPALPSPPPVERLIQWIREQRQNSALTFWSMSPEMYPCLKECPKSLLQSNSPELASEFGEALCMLVNNNEYERDRLYRFCKSQDNATARQEAKNETSPVEMLPAPPSAQSSPDRSCESLSGGPSSMTTSPPSFLDERKRDVSANLAGKWRKQPEATDPLAWSALPKPSQNYPYVPYVARHRPSDFKAQLEGLSCTMPTAMMHNMNVSVNREPATKS